LCRRPAAAATLSPGAKCNMAWLDVPALLRLVLGAHSRAPALLLRPAAALVAHALKQRCKFLRLLRKFRGEIVRFAKIVGEVVKLGLNRLRSPELLSFHVGVRNVFPRSLPDGQTISLFDELIAARLVALPAH